MLKSQSLLRLGFSFNGCILVKTVQVKHEDKNTVGAPSKILSEKDISEVIEMALSDHVSFSDIRNLHGLREAEVKLLMRKTLNTAVATITSVMEHGQDDDAGFNYYAEIKF